LFKNKTILITGAGSLGKALTLRLLGMEPKTIRLLDNHESTLYNIEQELSENAGTMRYFVGDVTDKDRVKRAMDGVDYVFHTAALKQVPYSNNSPWAYVNVNVLGTMVVVDAAIDADVGTVIVISTDKGVEALNVYGKTKSLAESVAVCANYYKGSKRTKIGVCRYGNVDASLGSVIPVWKEQVKKGRISVTDLNMRRFSISMDEALDFIYLTTTQCQGGEIFVPVMKTYTLGGLLKVLIDIYDVDIKKIGIRSGEKMFETLIGENEIRDTYDFGGGYVIIPNDEYIDAYNLKSGVYKQYPHPSFPRYTSLEADEFTEYEMKERFSKYFIGGLV